MDPDTSQPLTHARGNSTSELSLANRLLVAEQLARLIRAQLPLTQALRGLAGQAHGSLAQAIESVNARLEKGHSLTESVAHGSDMSARTLAATMELGQLCGRLDTAIEGWVSWQLNQQQHRRRLVSALVYPALLIFIALASLLFCVWRLIPHYEEAFVQLAESYPSWLKLLVTAHRYFWLLAPGVLVMVAAASWRILWRRGGTDRDGVPKDLATAQLFYSQAANLSMLGIRSGLPISSWLALVSNGLGIVDAQSELAIDDTWSHCLGKETSSVLNAVKAGQLQSDAAHSLLQTISRNYADLSEATVTRQVHWLPIVASASVGFLTILTYVGLIYLPWVALFFEIAGQR